MVSKRVIRCGLLSASVLSLLVISAGSSYSKTDSSQADPASKAEIQELMKELQSQKRTLESKEKELDDQQKILDEKLNKLDKTLTQADKILEEYHAQEMATLSHGKHNITLDKEIGAVALGNLAGRGTREVGTERKSESQQKPDVPTVAASSGGVLLPRGRVVIEPSVQYSRTSALRVAVEGFTVIPAINIGLFDISEIDRDITTAAITTRVGITDRIELEAYLPYLWRDDSTIGRPIGVGTATDVLNDVSGSGIGDVELAAHYQINNGKGGWPYFIGNIRYKTTTGKGPFDVPTDAGTGLQQEAPTGSGFTAIQPSVTMLYPSDPAVLFANLGYVYNMKDNVGGTIGEIDPGDSVNASFGMGFSINDRTSFSLGYSHSVVTETRQNGTTFANSDMLQVGATTVGYSYQVSDMIGLNFNVATGVTDDAPDMQATFRVPIKFDLF